MHHNGKRDPCLFMIFRSLCVFISYISNSKAFSFVTSYADSGTRSLGSREPRHINLIT